MKHGGEVDHSTVTRGSKNCLSCKNLDDQARSGRSKTVDSEATQVIVINLESIKQAQYPTVQCGLSHLQP